MAILEQVQTYNSVFQQINVNKNRLVSSAGISTHNLMTWVTNSVTRKKSPNVYKSFPKMISLEKW